MITYFFKIAFRNLFRNRVFTLINLAGLATGIMSFLFIVLWVMDELSYDRFHENSDRIYRIDWYSDHPQTRTPHPMTYTMAEAFPEVENAVSLSPVWGDGLTRPDRLVKNGELQFEENGIFAADTTFFEIFSFPLTSGDPHTCLDDVGSIVISETMAEKYFPGEDALGKMITINFGQDAAFRITGVMQEIPENSHFHFDFLLSYVTMKAYHTGDYYEWSDFGHYNYLLLREGTDPDQLEKDIVSWVQPYLDWPDTYYNQLQEGTIGFRLTPLEDIHLYSHIKWELEANGDIAYVYIFSSLGLFILLIAIINYVNIATARTSYRKTEIGVKKVLGAGRSNLRLQFLTESIVLSVAALILAIILFEILSIPVGNMAGKTFSINYANPQMLAFLILLPLVCGLLAGLYPAFILSSYRIGDMLKGMGSSKKRTSGFRNSLVVFQFAISIFLIIGTFTINNQVNFLQNKKLGFNSDQVLIVPIRDTLIQQNYESVKARLLKNSGISQVSTVSNIPGRRFNQNPIQWTGQEDQYPCSQIRVDHDFVKTLGLKIKNGRDFSINRINDTKNVFMINEAAAKLFDWEDPVNEELIWYDDENTRRGEVIGVLEDFHFQSLHSSIEPLIIQVNPEAFNYFLIRIGATDVGKTLSWLEAEFKQLDPANPFSYFFMNDDFRKLYDSEKRMQQIMGYFTMLALIISSIGLFGLSAFSAERRTKEIGIRKVNGATIPNIMIMLSMEYVRWILIAFLVAVPVGFMIMDNWLDHFAYQVGNGVWIYIAAGLIALLIGILTVGYQAYKAARKNPVDILRYE